MSRRFALSPIAVFALVLVAACSDGSTAAPPPPPHVVGVIRGTVSGDQMTAEYTPTGAAEAVYGDASPAIYGGPSTVKVSGTVDSLHQVAGVSRTWFIRVHMRNLLSFPIGSNQGGASPTQDSSGVYLAFTNLPLTVTQPSPCSGCSVTIDNQSGTRDFGSPAQPFFWYNSRPQAVQGSPSTDTTNDVVWKFKTTNVTPPDTTHGFTFMLTVVAAWGAPNETQWITTYDGLLDSLPDTQAEPRWRPFHATNTATTLGTESFTLGSGLTLTAVDNGHSIYMSRHDSVGTGTHYLYVGARVKLGVAAADTIQAVLGFAEPNGGRMGFIGIASNQVSFVTYTQSSGQWSVLGSPYNNGGAFIGTQFHTYRLRKLGNTDNHLCVDGVDALQRSYSAAFPLQVTQVDFFNSSFIFGSDGRGVIGKSVTSVWASVDYGVGTDGGNCGP